MAQIIVSPYEKTDLFRILEYAEEKKKEDGKNGNIKPKLLEIDLEKIRTLKARVMGKEYKQLYGLQSTSYDDGKGRKGAEEKDDLPKVPFKRVD